MIEPNAALLADYLLRRGWTVTQNGGRATLWSRSSGSQLAELGVPHAVRFGSFEWSDIVRRVAETDAQLPSAIEKELDQGIYDIARFPVAQEIAIDDTVALTAGATTIQTAYSMLRTVATTAQRPRSQIGANYSKIGDEYVRRARLGHTEHGSYVVPVLFSHDDIPADKTITPVAGTEHFQPESPQRRIVRTLSQALSTYVKRIIEPASEPGMTGLLPVVAAGGSRELFANVERVLSERSATKFATNFTWALGMPEPGNAAENVSIPVDALDIVKRTVVLLTEAKRQPLRIFTGPIVSISHDPGDPIGQIAVQAPSANGRPSRIHMRVREKQLGELHDWMNSLTTVTVQGTVERLPGRPLELKGIAVPMRLDDSFIDGGA